MYEPGTGTAAPQPSEFEMDGSTLIRYHGQREDVIVPSGVTAIGPYAFQFKQLTNLTLPDSLVRLDHHALFLCTALRYVRFGRSLEHIGEMAFGECHSLFLPALPESVRFIGPRAFSGCGLLGFLDIPASVSCISEKAFSYCPWLTGIIFHGEPEQLDFSAFMDCHRLERICGPASLLEKFKQSYTHPGISFLVYPPHDPGDRTGA